MLTIMLVAMAAVVGPTAAWIWIDDAKRQKSARRWRPRPPAMR